MKRLRSVEEREHREPVTMKKVAQEAGVSMATVSRVLNGSAPVDPLLVERVRTVMAHLKYQPNRMARALAGSNSMLIGLMISDIQNPFFIEVMRGVEEELQQNGYLLVLCTISASRREEEGYKAEEKYLEVLASAPVAGTIIIPLREQLKGLELLKARHTPIVVVDQHIRDLSLDVVRIDNVNAAKEAVAHLITNGYRRIGIITGPRLTPTANERLLGYRQALQEAGLFLDPMLEQRGPFLEETGERLIDTLLRLDPPVDAIFTTNNRLTNGALRALYARGKSVPDDVAFVGFDEMPWVISDVISVTTVMQPAYELGRRAASRLIQLLRQHDVARQDIVLPHQLSIRASSRPKQQSLSSFMS